MSFKLTDWSMRNLRLQVWVLFKVNNFLARQASQMRKSFAGTTLMSFSDSNESASLTHTHCSNSPLQYSRLEEAYWNEWPLGFDWNTWEYNPATWFTCTCMYQLACALCIFCLWSKTTVVASYLLLQMSWQCLRHMLEISPQNPDFHIIGARLWFYAKDALKASSKWLTMTASQFFNSLI